MSELVRFPRSPVRPAPRSFEDPRWAELHAPGQDAADVAEEDLESRALRMGAVALLVLPKPAPQSADEPIGAATDRDDCRCTKGTVCRHNNACPRLAAGRPS